MDKQDMENESFGILFPEAVGESTKDERYHNETEDSYTVGWYFETVLRQPFDYSKYPLDHKTIWISIIPANFMSDLIFLPDLDSYNSTGSGESYGMFGDIVLTGWSPTETFFSFQNRQYDTTFGFSEKSERQNHMELSFNIVIERDLGQAIIVSLTLVIVIMMLLYSLVIMVTSEEEKLHFYGMSARGAIGTASSLIFSVLMAHINLREQFSGGIAYLESFYYMAYLYILAISVLIYIFMKKFKDKNNWMVRNSAASIKLLYWPLYLGIMLVVTWVWL